MIRAFVEAHGDINLGIPVWNAELFKASVETLPDDELTVLIHRYAGDCKLKLSVKDSAVTVEDHDGEAQIEIEHKDAARFFFGIHSPEWKKLELNTKSWFPLPLFVEDADHV